MTYDAMMHSILIILMLDRRVHVTMFCYCALHILTGSTSQCCTCLASINCDDDHDVHLCRTPAGTHRRSAKSSTSNRTFHCEKYGRTRPSRLLLQSFTLHDFTRLPFWACCLCSQQQPWIKLNCFITKSSLPFTERKTDDNGV